jgi:hypothetical protein
MLPDVTVRQFAKLLGGAVSLMLVGFDEGLGAAKTYAASRGYAVYPNRELVALGASNLGSGMFSGMPVNGSLSKTAVNAGAGARSQISALTAAALTVLTLLFLTGIFEQLPLATLAAIVIAAVAELIDLRALRHLWRVFPRAGWHAPTTSPPERTSRRSTTPSGTAAPATGQSDRLGSSGRRQPTMVSVTGPAAEVSPGPFGSMHAVGVRLVMFTVRTTAAPRYLPATTVPTLLMTAVPFGFRLVTVSRLRVLVTPSAQV